MRGDDVIGIVAIHATVLAIIIGVFSAYALYVFSAVDQAESQAFQMATKVNDLTPPTIMGPLGQGIYIASDDANREKLLVRFGALAMGVALHGMPQHPADQGQEALYILSALCSYYPFPASVRPMPDGGYEVTFRPNMLQFDQPQALEKWARDVVHMSSHVFWAWQHNRGKLEEIVAAFRQKDAKEVRPPDGAPRRPTRSQSGQGEVQDLATIRVPVSAGGDPVLDAFIRNIGAAAEIARAAQSKLEEARAVRARFPKKHWAAIFLLLFGIAFFCGVIAPLAKPDVPRLLLIWVPISVYCLGFVFVVSRVLQGR